MKLFRVIMINANLPPIVEVVQANSRSHALNHVVKIRDVSIASYNQVFVEPYNMIATDDTNHNLNELVFDDDNRLVEYNEKTDRHVMQFEHCGVIYQLDLGEISLGNYLVGKFV